MTGRLLQAGYRVIPVNPNETQARVLISLVGLGQVGREPFQRTFGAIAGPARNVLGQ